MKPKKFEVTTQSTKFIVNGKEYNRIEDIPLEFRSLFEKRKNLEKDLINTSTTIHEITINGKKYNSPNEVPSEFQNLIRDEDGNGIPDHFENWDTPSSPSSVDSVKRATTAVAASQQSHSSDKSLYSYKPMRFGCLMAPLIIPIGIGIGGLVVYSGVPDFLKIHSHFSNLIFETLLYISGCFLIVKSFHIFYFAIKSKKWPQANGFILKNDSKLSCPRHHYRLPRYLHKIQYRYEIDGKEHTGNRVSYGTLPNTPLEYLHEGAPVSIYYDPNKPSRSVLFSGRVDNAFVLFLLGGFLIGLAFLLFRLLNG